MNFSDWWPVILYLSKNKMRGNAITHIYSVQSHPLITEWDKTEVIASSTRFFAFSRCRVWQVITKSLLQLLRENSTAHWKTQRWRKHAAEGRGWSAQLLEVTIWKVHGGGDAQGCLPLLWLHLRRTGDLQSSCERPDCKASIRLS